MSVRRRASREDIDVLLVSPSPTAGWRRADDELEAALEDLDVRVVRLVGDFRRADRMRRWVLRRLRQRWLWTPMGDLGKAATMRCMLRAALRRYRPRAIVYSTVTSTLLQPSRALRGNTAVWFDTPAAMNRPGTRNVVQRWLERRSMRKIGMLLPLGLEADRQVIAALPPKPAIALPVPVYPARLGGERRGERIAMTYARSLDKKGVDILAEAWQIAAPRGIRLIVSGAEPAVARDFLAREAIDEPPGIEWAGALGPEEHLRLRASAEIFVAASRYEDYGIAQLEALADGALLVTVPSGGPFPALSLARALEPRLVARSLEPADLAAAIRAAVEMTERERDAYRRRAAELIEGFSADALRDGLARQVLPTLLR